MNSTAAWRIQVFWDGDCPICRREIGFLQRRDRRNRIRFTDIAAPGFDPELYGTDMPTLMDRIMGRLPDGTWVEGIEVFRHLYAAINLGFLVPATRLPGVSHLLDWSYRKFAHNRLRWTGRCDATTGVCAVPSHR